MKIYTILLLDASAGQAHLFRVSLRDGEELSEAVRRWCVYLGIRINDTKWMHLANGIIHVH